MVVLALGLFLWSSEPVQSLGKKHSEFGYQISGDQSPEISTQAIQEAKADPSGCACFPGFPCFPDCAKESGIQADVLIHKELMGEPEDPVGNDPDHGGIPDQ